MVTELDLTKPFHHRFREELLPRYAAILRDERPAIPTHNPTRFRIGETDCGSGLVGLALNLPVVPTVDGMQNQPSFDPLRGNCPPFGAIDEMECCNWSVRRPGFLEFPRYAAVRRMERLSLIRTEPTFFRVEKLHGTDPAEVLHHLFDDLPRLSAVFCTKQHTTSGDPSVIFVNKSDTA